MLFEALYMSISVGIMSYILYALSHKGGYSNKDGAVNRKAKLNKDTGLKQDRKTGQFAIDKWLVFGGGYYGTVAFVKLVLSEVGQAYNFLNDWEGILTYLADLGIGTIVSFFINQLQTFIQAIIWPTDYFGDYSLFQLVILLSLSYGSYWWAQNLARAHHLKSKKSQ